MKIEIIFHTIWAILAHLSGFMVLIRTKGTRFHKLSGRVYSIAMFLTLASSFLIQEMWEGFGVFHVFTIVSLFSLLFGLYYPLFGRDKEGWQISHYWWMLYSYVGLWLATFSHIGAYLPFTNWVAFIAVMYVLPYAVATFSIVRFDRKTRSLYLTKDKV